MAVPNRFTIDTTKSGPGNLGVVIEGPSKIDVDIKDHGDGICDVYYAPMQPG